MRIALSKIEPGTNRFELDWPAGYLEPEDRSDGLRVLERIRGWIEIEPFEETPGRGGFMVRGWIGTKVKGECDRCLEEFARPVDLGFRVVLVRDLGTRVLEKELKGEELNYSLLEGEELDLRRIVYEQMILETDMVVLCSKECRGLCPVCGANLNTDPCDCRTRETDPRLAGLAGWRAPKD